jgi:hypothetical protein
MRYGNKELVRALKRKLSLVETRLTRLDKYRSDLNALHERVAQQASSLKDAIAALQEPEPEPINVKIPTLREGVDPDQDPTSPEFAGWEKCYTAAVWMHALYPPQVESLPRREDGTVDTSVFVSPAYRNRLIRMKDEGLTWNQSNPYHSEYVPPVPYCPTDMQG